MMIPSQLEKNLRQLTPPKLLVVGDLMLDEYLSGRSERISPEAPVPVVDVSQQELRLGGAGNVMHNLRALGCEVVSVGFVGEDEDGEALRRMLRLSGVETAGLLPLASRQTTRKTRILSNHQQMLRIDREQNGEISASEGLALLEQAEANLTGCQAILLSDYLKGVLTPEVVRGLIDLGRRQGIPVVVDPKGRDYSKYRGATLLTPNRKEAELATGIAITDETSLQRAGRSLLESCQLQSLVLTRSEEGMSIFSADSQTDLATDAREVFDVTGAGDTVLALLGYGIAAGLEVDDAACLANIGAGIVVAKVGTSTVGYDELLLEIRRRALNEGGKIVDTQLLAQELVIEKARGRKVVFTNGCFDLLHVGHVKYLQKARTLGDLLVLGLNSDASIRRLKGEKRPLIDQEERAHILAALDCIDYLVIFDEDTPLELITALRPDILVKGGDYQAEDVVGKDIVESYGGRVELISFVDGKSTTNIIDKILEQYRDEL
jgi:D-beta-D-heptose 7-phosphate kinase/D-beta-D-heptose 1-phosphate adenosyltransferase